MSNLFSIGEMSKIHHIPIKTLRYYDEIDLLKPEEVKPESGYRYYSYEQFETLNTIMFLKYLGIPLKEIKGYLEVRDKRQYIELLKKEKKIIEDKMYVFKQMLASIDRQMTEVTGTMVQVVYDEVTVQTLPQRHVFYQGSKINNNDDLEIALHQLKGKVYKDMPIVVGLVGLMIKKAHLIDRKYGAFDGIFILAEKELGTTLIEEGTYACICYKGEDHVASPQYYEKIQAYLDANGYVICGDGVERVIINHYKSNDPNEYLTEIQVPITRSHSK